MILGFFVNNMSQSPRHSIVDLRVFFAWSDFARVLFILVICVSGIANTQAGSLGDFDRDTDVDILDLAHFASQWLETSCGNPDWCEGADINRSTKVDMADFTILSQNWLTGSTRVINPNNAPLSLASGPQGNIYVTDNKVGSVFVYDPNLVVTGQIRGLDKPLGVAVDAQGNIYVGNRGTKSIEKYSSSGAKMAVIANDIELANDLEFDREGNLYVTDSKAHKVRVFSPGYVELPSITSEHMKYPTAIAIDYVDDGTGQMVGELFVSSFVTVVDDPNFIRVFDLAGDLKRNFGMLVTKSMMGSVKWQGKFIKIQSMQIGPDGNLHVLDPSLAKCQIINPVTGEYFGYYGLAGTNPGQLNLPLDILIDQAGRVIVANYSNNRVEIIHTLPK
jgi:hypothetical protein